MNFKCTVEMKYEWRTSKALARSFDDWDLAQAWIKLQREKNPNYAASLKLFKITTHTSTYLELLA